MRLTLRTLLAYLDDRLPPANAREIGQKISRSPFATELMDRIRDVVRRRRLAAPDKPVTMIDANLVAEYLDDQLTPELVARIEREILQSDAALAEVAATHQILGLLRDPVALESRLRDRLYVLDPSGKLEVVQLLSGAGASGNSEHVGNGAPEWKPLANRTQSSGRLQIFIIASLALLWLVVMLTDSQLFHSGSSDPVIAQTDADRNDRELNGGDHVDPVVADADVATAAKGETETGTAGKRETSSAGEPSMPDRGAVTASEQNDAGGKSEAIAHVEEKPPAGSPSDPEKGTGTVGSPAAVASGSPATSPTSAPVVAPTDAVRPADTIPDAPAAPAVTENTTVYPVYLTDEYQMTLLLSNSGAGWKRAAAGAATAAAADQLRLRDWRDTLHAQWLGIPAPFQVQISVSGSGWRCLMPGPSVVSVINLQTAGMWVSQGRVLVSRDTAAAVADDAPVSFMLKIGDSITPLILMTPDTRFAVEVFPELAEPIAGPTAAGVVDNVTTELPLVTDRQVRLTVIQGKLQLSAADGQSGTELLKAQALTWRVLDSGGISAATMVAANPQTAMPEWVFRVDAELIPEQKSMLSQVAGAFSANDNLKTTILALSKDRNSQVGALGIGVAALTRDVETMMTVLMQSGEELVRRAAIDGLSLAVNEIPDGYDQVRKSLETRLPMNEVDVMLKLITGINEQDIRNQVVCAELVLLLSHDRAATRELAFYRMESVVGDRFGYHADSDPGRRREAIRRWQRHIDRNNGKLVP